MKVELSIKDDTELRNMIKDAIRGQVNSLVRDNVMEFLNQAIDKRVNGSVPQIIKTEVTNCVRTVLGMDGPYFRQSRVIDELVKAEVQKMVADRVTLIVK